MTTLIAALLRCLWSLPCVYVAPTAPRSPWEEWAEAEGRAALQSLNNNESGLI